MPTPRTAEEVELVVEEIDGRIFVGVKGSHEVSDTSFFPDEALNAEQRIRAAYRSLRIAAILDGRDPANTADLRATAAARRFKVER